LKLAIPREARRLNSKKFDVFYREGCAIFLQHFFDWKKREKN
jgi:hypothetical protein